MKTVDEIMADYGMTRDNWETDPRMVADLMSALDSCAPSKEEDLRGDPDTWKTPLICSERSDEIERLSVPSAIEPPQDWKDIFVEYEAHERSQAWLYQQIEEHARIARKTIDYGEMLGLEMQAHEETKEDLAAAITTVSILKEELGKSQRELASQHSHYDALCLHNEELSAAHSQELAELKFNSERAIAALAVSALVYREEAMTKNPEQRGGGGVAESQAPSIRDGDTGAAPGRHADRAGPKSGE